MRSSTRMPGVLRGCRLRATWYADRVVARARRQLIRRLAGMSLELRKHPSFAGRPGPVLLVIADGVGVAPPAPSNAVTVADTPTLDELTGGELYTELAAHGPAVGLPTDDDMGNSEVGHNALGAGRIFAQGAKLVNQAIETGAIFETDVWHQAIEHGSTGTLHLLGLHSDGNVHSHNDHLYAMLRRAADEGVTSAAVHILHDGRDVPARSALDYIATTEAVLAEINADDDRRNFRIASGGGRMKITMDRYGADWAMVERGYHCHTHGEGRPFDVGHRGSRDDVRRGRRRASTGDQYLGRVRGRRRRRRAGRHDRRRRRRDALQLPRRPLDRDLTRLRGARLRRVRPTGRGRHPDVFFAGMLQYDGDALVPKQYLVEPPAIDRTMSEFLCAEGCAQLRGQRDAEVRARHLLLERQPLGLHRRIARDLHRDPQRQRRVRHHPGDEGPRDHRRGDRSAAQRRVPVRHGSTSRAATWSATPATSRRPSRRWP